MLSSILRLIRVPNLFSVFGDPLLGFIICVHSLEFKENLVNLNYLIFSVLLAYIFGMVINDIVDYEEDCEKSPNRPLPSGEISINMARTIAVIVLLSNIYYSFKISTEFLFFDVGLIILIFLYTFSFKNNKILGPVVMAMCRMTSVTLGVVAGLGLIKDGYNKTIFSSLIVLLIPLFFYFVGVTKIAFNETEKIKKVSGRMPILFSLIIYLTTLMFMLYLLVKQGGVISDLKLPLAGLGLGVLFVFFAFKSILSLTKNTEPQNVQKQVGFLIRNYILFQASWCGFLEAGWCMAVLLVSVYYSWRTSNKFYST
jgi:4-hydroxybenzoate polyprenyltransferase